MKKHITIALLSAFLLLGCGPSCKAPSRVQTSVVTVNTNTTPPGSTTSEIIETAVEFNVYNVIRTNVPARAYFTNAISVLNSAITTKNCDTSALENQFSQISPYITQCLNPSVDLLGYNQKQNPAADCTSGLQSVINGINKALAQQ